VRLHRDGDDPELAGGDGLRASTAVHRDQEPRERTLNFRSVEVYSSTTEIPYVITGIANSVTVLSIRGTQPQTFGNFARLTNPQPDTQIDGLIIRVTNTAYPCCSNPVGIDNIVLAR
jgi:hypothetical protein